jgi:serine protease DegQ
LRIEKIVRTAYLDYHVYDRNGFLGISQQNVPVVHADDARIREGHIGIKVREVIANTAAQEAGFKAEDVIVALDGEPLSSKTASPTTEFGESIRGRGPGTTVTLSILRGPRELEVRAVLRPRPREYYGRHQITVSPMLEGARERFRIWWSVHFRQASALRPGRGRR